MDEIEVLKQAQELISKNKSVEDLLDILKVSVTKKHYSDIHSSKGLSFFHTANGSVDFIDDDGELVFKLNLISCLMDSASTDIIHFCVELLVLDSEVSIASNLERVDCITAEIIDDIITECVKRASQTYIRIGE